MRAPRTSSRTKSCDRSARDRRLIGVRSYLKLTGLTLGLLINFNVAVLKDGIKRRSAPESLLRFRRS